MTDKKLANLFWKISSVLLSLVLLTACSNAWQKHYDLGMKYLSDGNYEEAIIEFEAAIEIDDKKAEAYVGLVEANVQSGKADKAFEVAKEGYAKTKSSLFLEKIKDLVLNHNLLVDVQKLADKEVDFCVDGIYLGEDISKAKKKYGYRKDYLSNLMTGSNGENDCVYNMPFLDSPILGHDENEFGYIFASNNVSKSIEWILIRSDYPDNQFKCANQFSPNDRAEKALEYFFINENYADMPDGEYEVFSKKNNSLNLSISDGNIKSLSYTRGKQELSVAFKSGYIDYCKLEEINEKAKR